MIIAYKTTAKLDMSVATHYAVMELCTHGLQLQAIKFISKQYKIDLLEAKSVVEAVISDPFGKDSENLV